MTTRKRPARVGPVAVRSCIRLLRDGRRISVKGAPTPRPEVSAQSFAYDSDDPP